MKYVDARKLKATRRPESHKEEDVISFVILIAMLILLIAGYFLGYKTGQGDALQGTWKYELNNTTDVVRIK